MKPLGKMMRHVQLVSRMAKATDTDLVAAYQAQELSQQDWADMVQTCRRCEWADKCETWLRRQDKTIEVPDTCLNYDQFRARAHREAEVA